MNPSIITRDIFETIEEAEARFRTLEPRVQAFLPEEGRFERLRREAQELLERFPEASERPPLFGLLAGAKDIYHVDGFETKAGSRLPVDELRGAEAESVTRLKQAGALLLGKTVTTEFAYFSPGPTRNPHNPEHTPGGSSSGSAAAIAAGLCSLTLGTQTIGSLIRPGAFCGVLALKPSYARISTQGIIPLAPALDHAGFFAVDLLTAKQAAACLYQNWGDSHHKESRPVLGLPEGPYLENAGPEGMDRLEAARDALVEAGYEVRRVRAMPDFADILGRHQTILAAQAAAVHKAWFERYENLYAPKTAELIRQGLEVSVSQLDAALRAARSLRDELQALMMLRGIDMWIAPSAPGAAPRGLESTGDPVMNLPWTQAGLPALNIPSGKNNKGLPLGLQLIGRWHADEDLLAWAEGIEPVVGRP